MEAVSEIALDECDVVGRERQILLMITLLGRAQQVARCLSLGGRIGQSKEISAQTTQVHKSDWIGGGGDYRQRRDLVLLVLPMLALMAAIAHDSNPKLAQIEKPNSDLVAVAFKVGLVWMGQLIEQRQ